VINADSARTVEQNDSASAQVQKIVSELRDLLVKFQRVIQNVHQFAEDDGEQGLEAEQTRGENGTMT
jgi:hypothetical protein